MVNVTLRMNLIPSFDAKDFVRALRDCKGSSPVLLGFRDDRDACAVLLNDCRVAPSPERIMKHLAGVVPPEALSVSFGPLGQ